MLLLLLLLLVLLILLPPDPTKDCKDKFWSNKEDSVFVVDILTGLTWPEADNSCASAVRDSNDDGSDIIRINDKNTIDKNVVEEFFGLTNLNI